ncbi:cupredoxin domain-containing protein [Azospira restricta]|uniref:Cupredoxin domain-containing protein n=1 Tax=Azospira restricta TaxID=404405 RepID=A0A974SNW4_9RHOO|nr:cupredoxin domain-containing protein [Azospira restricta]QRJ63757.1 cupredoxin domain-containing protein [Azospira restricta]
MKFARLAALACLAAGVSFPVLAADYIDNAKDYVDKADWKAMTTVTVEMSEHHYQPEDIRFQAGKAYKVQLKNVGEKDHYFTSPEFNRAVAWRKIMVNGQMEAKAPYFTAFEVLKKGGQLDLYFVPVKAGSYPVYCTIDDHREKGMEGQLIIE